MTHLTPDQLIDAIDGTLSDDGRGHLTRYASCRVQVDDLAIALRSTEALDLPEPSPLFWPHFSNRVRSAVEAEGAPAHEWPRWLQWPVLAPIAGLALVLAALAVTLPRATSPLPIEVSETQNGDVLVDDDGWTLVADAVGDLDWDTASAAGLTVEPGAVDRVVLELTADEQRALTALLHAELRAKS